MPTLTSTSTQQHAAQPHNTTAAPHVCTRNCSAQRHARVYHPSRHQRCAHPCTAHTHPHASPCSSNHIDTSFPHSCRTAGGTAVVYKAGCVRIPCDNGTHHATGPSLSPVVAIKAIDTSPPVDPALERNIEREVRVISQLSHAGVEGNPPSHTSHTFRTISSHILAPGTMRHAAFTPPPRANVQQLSILCTTRSSVYHSCGTHQHGLCSTPTLHTSLLKTTDGVH